MQSTSLEATGAIFRADPTITPAERKRLLSILRLGGKEQNLPNPSITPEPRLLRRAEAARRLAVSVRAVDAWAKSGILNKVRLPGRKRAAGFRESDIVGLMQGRG